MKKRILCFGDSNTWGYNALGDSRFDEDVRWTGILQNLLGEEYTVIEEGQNGRTTVIDDPYENRLAGITYLWPCMETHHPFDLIVIMLGTNDSKNHFCLSAESIALGAGRLVDMAMKSPFGINRNPPKVLLVSPIRIKQRACCDYIFNIQAEQKSEGFSVAFKEVAEKMGCYFIDAAELAEPCDEDGVHLNAAGHKKIAEGLYKKIIEII